MNLSIFDKISVLFKYLFSSFLSIEIFIVTLLLFLILVFTINKKYKFLQLCVLAVYIGFILGVFASYNIYTQSCIDSFFKAVMNYIYFPSPIVYFLTIIGVTILLIISIYSSRITKFKKIFNYAFFCFLYFFFMSFIAVASVEKIDLMDKTIIYGNNTMLSIIQVSNFILLIWIIFTFFYILYKYFKRKYD